MPDVFISYAREDREKAESIAECFTSIGYDVWWDLESFPGSNFANNIEAVIRGAEAVIVLWSQVSINSDFVVADAKLALEEDVYIPVSLDGVSVPLPFGVRHIHGLEDWDGSAQSNLLDPLIAAVHERANPFIRRQTVNEEVRVTEEGVTVELPSTPTKKEVAHTNTQTWSAFTKVAASIVAVSLVLVAGYVTWVWQRS